MQQKKWFLIPNTILFCTTADAENDLVQEIRCYLDLCASAIIPVYDRDQAIVLRDPFDGNEMGGHIKFYPVVFFLMNNAVVDEQDNRTIQQVTGNIAIVIFQPGPHQVAALCLDLVVQQ